MDSKNPKLIWLRPVAVLCLFLASLSHFSPAGFAQQAAGRLKGIVVDRQYARVARAKITFESGTLRKEVLTDEEGVYEVELPSGTYQVTATSQGFAPRRFKFGVEPETVKKLNMILDTAPMKFPKCPKGRRPCIYL